MNNEYDPNSSSGGEEPACSEGTKIPQAKPSPTSVWEQPQPEETSQHKPGSGKRDYDPNNSLLPTESSHCSYDPNCSGIAVATVPHKKHKKHSKKDPPKSAKPYDPNETRTFFTPPDSSKKGGYDPNESGFGMLKNHLQANTNVMHHLQKSARNYDPNDTFTLEGKQRGPPKTAGCLYDPNDTFTLGGKQHGPPKTTGCFYDPNVSFSVKEKVAPRKQYDPNADDSGAGRAQRNFYDPNESKGTEELVKMLELGSERKHAVPEARIVAEKREPAVYRTKEKPVAVPQEKEKAFAQDVEELAAPCVTHHKTKAATGKGRSAKYDPNTSTAANVRVVNEPAPVYSSAPSSGHAVPNSSKKKNVQYDPNAASDEESNSSPPEEAKIVRETVRAEPPRKEAADNAKSAAKEHHTPKPKVTRRAKYDPNDQSGVLEDLDLFDPIASDEVKKSVHYPITKDVEKKPVHDSIVEDESKKSMQVSSSAKSGRSNPTLDKEAAKVFNRIQKRKKKLEMCKRLREKAKVRPHAISQTGKKLSEAEQQGLKLEQKLEEKITQLEELYQKLIS